MVEKRIPITNIPDEPSETLPPLTEDEMDMPLQQFLSRVSGNLRRRDFEQMDGSRGLHRTSELKAKREKKTTLHKRRSGSQRRNGKGLPRTFFGQRSPFV